MVTQARWYLIVKMTQPYKNMVYIKYYTNKNVFTDSMQGCVFCVPYSCDKDNEM